MAALIQVANRLGLYDAADAVKQMSSNPPPPGRKPAAGQSPIRMDEGPTQRGNGNGEPTTPKPPIKPQPSGGRMIDASGMTIGYQPRSPGGPIDPPPRNP